jgi:hypothetical protein
MPSVPMTIRKMSPQDQLEKGSPTEQSEVGGGENARTSSGMPLKLVLIVGISFLFLAVAAGFGAGYMTHHAVQQCPVPPTVPKVTLIIDGASKNASTTTMRGAGLLAIEEAAKQLVVAGVPDASAAVEIDFVIEKEVVRHSVNVKIGEIMDAEQLPNGTIRYDMNDDGTGAFAMSIEDGDNLMYVKCMDSMHCYVSDLANHVGEDTGKESNNTLDTGSSHGRKLWKKIRHAVKTVYHAQNRATDGPTKRTVTAVGQWYFRVVCWPFAWGRRICATLRVRY